MHAELYNVGSTISSNLKLCIVCAVYVRNVVGQNAVILAISVLRNLNNEKANTTDILNFKAKFFMTVTFHIWNDWGHGVGVLTKELFVSFFHCVSGRQYSCIIIDYNFVSVCVLSACDMQLMFFQERLFEFLQGFPL